VVHIDFYEDKKYRQVFRETKDPDRILDQLRLAGHIIEPEHTLLIFDEIQECPDALGALKYFQEKRPEYHVACAGSLLGVRLAQGGSFPVGKVDYLRLYPMSFTEFLRADDSSELADFIVGLDRIEQIPELIFDRLTEKLKAFFAVGGMPEATEAWVKTRDMSRVERVLSANLLSYDQDFSKHLSATEAQKVSRIWHSLPSQLSKENKKFTYALIRETARAREYEPSIDWLADADMIYRTNRITAPRLPLSAYDDYSSFKLYAADNGLLRKLAVLDTSVLIEGSGIFTDFKGAFSENYVINALSPLFEAPLRYWSMLNPSSELDFIVQHRDRVIPVEVKAGENTKSPSLRRYRERFAKETGVSLRFSLRNLYWQEGILNIPLFLADRTLHLIDLVSQ
jgi:predicted AAA+ superfamily ATPase